MKKLILALSLVLICAGISSTDANATTSIAAGGGITAGGGSALISSTAPTLGGELTFGVGNIDFGALYLHDILSVTGGSGGRDYVAGLFRFTIPFSFGVFVDATMGLSTSTSTIGGAVVNTSDFGIGLGAGSKISLGPTFALIPRVAFHTNPTIFDATLMFAVVIP